MKKTTSFLLAAIAISLAAGSCPAQEIGSTPPDFKAKDITGQTVSLSGLKGKVVLLDFWATWCPPCRAEVPKLLEIHKSFQDKKFVLLSVSLDRDLAAARTFVADKKMEWVHVIDAAAGPELANQYGIEYIPATFVIDRQGKLAASGLRGAALKEKIAALLK